MEQLKTLIAYTSFDNMKQVPSLDIYQLLGALEETSAIFKSGSKFFVKGQVGNWYSYFSEELSDRFDKVIQANLKYKARIEYGEKPKIEDQKEKEQI